MQGNLGAFLEGRAQAHPDRPLFSYYDGDGKVRASFSYGSFLRRARFVADRLRGFGVSANEPVLLVYPPGSDMAVAFFAAVLIGAIPVPAPPPSWQKAGRSRLLHIARDAGAVRALSTARLAEQFNAAQVGGDASETHRLNWFATDDLDGELDELQRAMSDVLLVQYTSGSTGNPRGVAVSHANAVHNAGLFLPEEPQIGVSWLPHYHDMGLIGYHVCCVVKGGQSHFFSPLEFLRRPVLWFELITRLGATMTTAPNEAYDRCAREDRLADEQLRGIDLSSLRSMANCAEPVRATTFERFRQRFSRYGLSSAAQVTAYGLAEHTLCATIGGSRVLTKSVAAGAEPPRSLVSCGRPAADVALRIVDPATRRPVENGAVGEIWLDSPSKAIGYWRLPDESKARFEAHLADRSDGRGYLRTGDLGFLDRGELFVCGRLRDMLVVNGRNIFPADVEETLEEAFRRQLPGRVVAFGADGRETGTEGLVVLVEETTELCSLAEVAACVRQSCEIEAELIARVPRGTIARTSSGKIARQACREKWERREITALELLRPRDAGDIADLIERLVAQAAALGDPGATIERLGLDSVALVDLSLALEDELERAGLATEVRLEQAADMSLIQSVRVADLQRAFARRRAGGAIGAIAAMFDAMAAETRQAEQARMHTDAAMPLPAPAAAGRASGSLLTGATGFLGSFLLKSVLELTDGPVSALVRAGTPGEGVARLQRALREAGMPTATVDDAFGSRLRVVLGDLERPRLGLSDEVWRRLAASVGRIYHCGAQVDYVKSYAALRPANVCATRDIIELASTGCRKSLHYVSTTFVFGWSVKPVLLETDNNERMEDLDFGYSQSKWVAEQLVLRAGRQGLDTTIYRPALASASASGRYVRGDVAARVLGYMIRNGLAVDALNQISLLPVDVCAHNIAALSLAEVQQDRVLHLTADSYYNIGEICRIIESRHGYPFEQVSLEEFVAHAHRHSGPADEIYPLIGFLDRNTRRLMRMDNKRYSSACYRRARERVPLAVGHPRIESVLDSIVAFLQRERLIPPPPVRTVRRAAART